MDSNIFMKEKDIFMKEKGGRTRDLSCPFDILVVTFVLLDGSVTHGNF
jgi:hypothetical protein